MNEVVANATLSECLNPPERIVFPTVLNGGEVLEKTFGNGTGLTISDLGGLSSVMQESNRGNHGCGSGTEDFTDTAGFQTFKDLIDGNPSFTGFQIPMPSQFQDRLAGDSRQNGAV